MERYQPRRRRRARRIALVSVVIVFALAASLGALGWAAYQRVVVLPDILQVRIDLMPEYRAQEGTVVQDETPEGQFRMVLNQIPTVQPGADSCSIECENPASNPYDLRVLLYDEDGQLLGQTHRIRRNERLELMRLDPVPPPGDYAATAVLEMIDEDLEVCGQVSAAVTLRVLE